MVHNPSAKFIPDSDRDFAGMGRSFSDIIANDPSRYRISASEAAEISKAVAEFRAALSVAFCKGTRTTITIMQKDAARARAEKIIRKYGKLIRANEEISRADKVVVGVKERPGKLQRSVLPETPPTLSYVACSDASAGPGGFHILEFREEHIERIHAKPRGAARVEIFVELVAQGEPIPKHPGELSGGRPWYLRSFTRSPMKVEFPIPIIPMLIVYWARWADASGKVGRFSKTVEARVEGWGGTNAHMALENREHKTEARRITTICAREDRYLEQCDNELLLTDESENHRRANRALPDETATRRLTVMVNQG